MYNPDLFQQEMMQMVREPVIRGADKQGLTLLLKERFYCIFQMQYYIIITFKSVTIDAKWPQIQGCNLDTEVSMKPTVNSKIFNGRTYSTFSEKVRAYLRKHILTVCCQHLDIP